MAAGRLARLQSWNVEGGRASRAPITPDPDPAARPAALAALFLAAWVCLPGCGPGRFTPEDPPQEKPRMREAYDLYLAGEFGRASVLFYRSARSGRPETASRAWYWLGRCFLAQDRPAAAREALRKSARIASRLHLRDLSASALMGLADACLRSGSPARALEALDVLEAEGLRGRVRADEFVFKRGLAFEAMGRDEDAERAFRRLIAGWPGGGFAPEAERRLGLLSLRITGLSEPARARFIRTREARESAHRGRATALFTTRAAAEAACAGLTDSGRGFEVRPVERDGRVLFGLFSREAR